MTHEYVKKRLSGISKKDLDKAQRQLSRWCQEVGIKEFNIDAGQADWRELVYRLLSLDPPKKEMKSKGRKIKHSKDFELQVILKLADYTFLNIDGKPLKGKALYETVAKEMGVNPELKIAHDNEYTKPSEVIKS
jgi:hypothetical protein